MSQKVENNSVNQSQSSGGLYSSVGNFVPGASAACVSAFLNLKNLMTEISSLYGEQFMSQVDVASKGATLSADFTRDQAEKNFIAGLASGIGSSVGGLVSFGGGASGLKNFGINETQIQATQAEIDSLSTMKTQLNPDVNANVDDLPPAENGDLMPDDKTQYVTDRLEQINDDLKSGKVPSTPDGAPISDEAVFSEMTEEQKATLNENLDQAIKDKTNLKAGLIKDAKEQAQHMSTLVQGAGQLLKGGGDITAAPFQQEATEDQADQTMGDSATKLAQSGEETARNNATQYFNNALEVLQSLVSINQSNQQR